MLLCLASRIGIAAVLAAATVSAFSQVVPAATEGGLPFSAGGGLSSYDVDWGHGRMLGGTLWFDYTPGFVPTVLRGIGIEAEARDISFDRGTHTSNFRQDTAGGGPIYTWHHYRNFYPYGKALLEFGSIDFQVGNPTYTHDTRTVLATGGGVETRVYHHVWVRADYEYQFWQTLIGGRLDPQGFTLGVKYDFRAFHPRQ
jgi:opacity protein-like surface antigen